MRPGPPPPPHAGEGRGGGFRRTPLRIFFAVLIALIVIIGGYFVLPSPDLKRSRSLSMLVLARDGSILRGFLTEGGKWRLPVTAGEIDPVYRRMLIAAEDQRFAEHPGIDPIAGLRALGQLALRGHIVSGASTLTMQAVRLLERRPRGWSWWRRAVCSA